MGLSSSQARLLTLTSRMHQIEYKAAKLEAMKLQMANESSRVYEEYLDALDKTKVQIKAFNTDGSVTYNDITDYTQFTGAGYAIDFNGIVYDNTTQRVKGDADGKYYASVEDAVEAGNTAEGSKTVTLTFGQLCNDAFGTPLDATPTGKDVEVVLTNLINSGQVTIVQMDKATGAFPTEEDPSFSIFETSVATNTGLREVSDEVDIKKAEAKYEADMRKIDAKDRKYDSDLAAIESERNAIKQEMETLKTVAKDNVERTFKLFS